MSETQSFVRRILTAVLVMVLSVAAPAGADVVTDWNAELLESVRAERTSPPPATRAMALMNVAIFDAVNGVDPRYHPYLIGADPIDDKAGLSAVAAAATAAHGVLVDLYPGRQAGYDALLAGQLSAVPDGAAKAGGVEWGEIVAQVHLQARKDDGSVIVREYQAPEGAGWWVRTGPGFAAPLLPNWRYVDTWSIESPANYRQPAPPPLTSDEYRVAFNEVKRLGAADSTVRTADQSLVARFWDDGPGTNTPPGHWNLILQDLISDEVVLADLVDRARLFALHGITVADAAIVAWDNKYHWDHWRPVTGIHEADHDANPGTVADPSWQSYITNPPFPAYTSGHSTFSGSSARVAALALGRDDFPFTAPSDGTPDVFRSYDSLSQAALEAGMSRIYGGIHWQYDNQGGLTSGRRVAEHVFFHQMRPRSEDIAACDPEAGHLCLGEGGRFAVRVQWATDEDSGMGVPVELPAEAGGYFWFFHERNPELTVKVLDGCAAFGHHWVFASGLTNVEVLLQVTDTQTGTTRNYFSPAGSVFEPVQDTAAFPGCP